MVVGKEALEELHMTSRTLIVSLTAAAGFVVLFANDNLLSPQSSLISQADARVGRPLTPGSVAGVARRSDRRAYRRGAVAAGAVVGTGAYYGAGSYYGSNAPYYGTGGIWCRRERRMERRAIRRGYYGNSGYYPGGYAGSAGYSYASGAAPGGFGFASSAYGAGDAYILRGAYINEADALAYCAQTFRSYDSASRTFLSRSGQRVSCPQ